MRNATKNILYTVVNSGAYFEESYNNAMAMPAWRVKFIAVDIIIVLLIAAAEAAVIYKSRKKSKRIKIE